jgi:hypothetical protein
VRSNVREQVVDDLAQPLTVAEHAGRLGLEGDRAPGLHDRRGLDGLADQLVQVDGLALQRTALVEPCEQEQVLDEQAHPLRLAADSGHQACQILGPPVRSPPVELGVGAHGGERRAQLVGGVGQKPAELSLRGRLRLEGRLDLTEHRVEGQAEPTDLGPRLRMLDAACQVSRRDRRRGRLDRAEGTKAEPDDPEAQPRERREGRSGDEQLDQQQPAQRRVHVGEGGREDEDPVRVPLDRGAHAVAAAAVLGPDGEVARTIGSLGRRRNVDRRRQPRRRQRLARDVCVQVAAVHRPVRAPELDEVSRASPGRLSSVARAAAVLEGADDAEVRVLEGLVRARDEKRAQRRVGRDVGDGEPDGAQHDDAEHETRAQGQS